MLYSKSTGGFYDEVIHGARKVLVPDPSFVPPEGAESQEAPTIEVDNPGCSIPADAVSVSDETYHALLALQSAGATIQADANGNPIAVPPAPPTPELLWAGYKGQAQCALSQSDITILRCVESGATVPQAWADYRKALRAIVAASSGDPSQSLPMRPAFPSGT